MSAARSSLCACLLALCCGTGLSAAPRVVLVGVDGASWSVIDPLLAAGKLPNLAALIARGVSAELETVEPVISPVVWTSIATGQRPEVHGVHDFFAEERAQQLRGAWPAGSAASSSGARTVPGSGLHPQQARGRLSRPHARGAAGG